MNNFDPQRGEFGYYFKFRPSTGDVSFNFHLTYESGTDSEYDSPNNLQTINTDFTENQNIAQGGSYMAAANYESGMVDVYFNPYYTIKLGNPNTYSKINRLHGDITGTISGFGKSMIMSDDTLVVGAPNSNENSGSFMIFQSYIGGGQGVTGSDGWSQKIFISGEHESGFFGEGLAMYEDSFEYIISASAPHAESGSGLAKIYDQTALDFLKTIRPVGENVSGFGKSMSFSKGGEVYYLALSSEQGGTGKIDFYKEETPDSRNFSYYYSIQSPDAHVDDMFGYQIESCSGQFFISSPLQNASGAVYNYIYDSSSGKFRLDQKIENLDGSAGDSFGKNISFDNYNNGLITSDKDGGRGYIYSREGQTWTQISEISGDSSVIDKSFGGNISGSFCSNISDETVIIGTSEEDQVYYFTTGDENLDSYTGVSLSGSNGKLYDSDSNFIYGYNNNEVVNISGWVFPEYYNISINGYYINTRSSREPGQGLTGAINSWSISGEDKLDFYALEIYDIKKGS